MQLEWNLLQHRTDDVPLCYLYLGGGGGGGGGGGKYKPTPITPDFLFSHAGRLLSTTSGAYGRGVEAPEYHTFREYYDRLVHAIQDPLHLAARLFIRNIIDSTLLQCMIVPALPPFDKTNTLLTAVLGKVQTDPRMFGVFLSALNEDPSMQSLVESMQGKCFIDKFPMVPTRTPTPTPTSTPPSPIKDGKYWYYLLFDHCWQSLRS